MALLIDHILNTSRRLVTNSSDRTLRQFNLPIYPPPNADREYIEQELEPTHRFNDPINKTAWHAMSYSPDGEWLAGGAADPATHKIYIWDIQNDGQFASALDGGREPLIHIHVWSSFFVPVTLTSLSSFAVAPIQIFNSVDDQSRQYPHMALSDSRALGCFCGWV